MAFETIEARLELAADQFTSTIGDATSQLGNLESSSKDVNKAVGALGGVLAGAGAAALGTAASRAMDFETAMADVEKVTDPQTAEDMGGAIRDMAGEIPLAHDELAELATQAGRMGAEGTDEITEFTETAAKMGSATVLSSDEAGTALGKLATAVDEPLDQVGALGDSVNEVSNNFATDSQEIIESAQRSGQALSNLGMESESIMGLSGAFNEVSPTSRIAASRMQAVGEAMMDPGNVDMFADAIGVTSDEFANMRDESPEDTMLEIMDSVDEGRLSFEEMSDNLKTETARAFRDTAGAGDRMREAMEMSNEAAEEGESLAGELATETDTLSGQMQLFRNRLNSVAIQIGENLTPYLRGMMDTLNDAFGAFEAVQDATGGWAGTLAAIGAVIAGTAAAASTLVAYMGGLAGVQAAVASAAGPLVAAISALSAPILVAVGAVALLAAAFATDFAGIRTATMRVVDTLRDALQPAFEWLTSNGVSIFNTIKDAVLDFVELAEPYIVDLADLIADGLIFAIESLGEAFTIAFGHIETIVTTVWENVLEPFLTWASDAWEEHGDAILEVVEPLWDTIKTVFKNAIEIIKEVVSLGLSVLEGDWSSAKESILNIVGLMWDSLKSVFTGAFETLKNIVILGWNAITDWVSGIGTDDVKAAFKAIGSGIRTIILGLFGAGEWLWNTVTGLLGDLKDWIQNDSKEDLKAAFDSVSDAIKDVIKALFGAGGDLWEIIKGFVSDFVTYIESGEAYEDIKSAFGSLTDVIYAAFEGLYEGLIGNSLIKDMMGDIVDYLSEEAMENFEDAVGDLVDAGLEKVEEKASDFKDAGKGLITALKDGVKEKADAVEDSVEGVADTMRGYFNGSDAEYGPLSNTTDAGEALPETLAKGMENNAGAVGPAAERVASNAKPQPNVGSTSGGGGAQAIEVYVNSDDREIEQLLNMIFDRVETKMTREAKIARNTTPGAR